nr:hypothetical protein [Endozoicomonas sp. SESOKO1]
MLPEPVNNPRFNQRLAADANCAGFFIQFIDNPCREVNVNPFGFKVGPLRMVTGPI